MGCFILKPPVQVSLEERHYSLFFFWPKLLYPGRQGNVRLQSTTIQQFLWLPARFCIHGYSLQILICSEALMEEQRNSLTKQNKNHLTTHTGTHPHMSIYTKVFMFLLHIWKKHFQTRTHSCTHSSHMMSQSLTFMDQLVLAVFCCISLEWARE